MSFRTYLFFGGNCREAMTHYREVFGGELQVMTMADAPADARPPGASPDLVMHANLTLTGGGMLMASDDPTGGFAGNRGFAVSHTAADADEAHRLFDRLMEGGDVFSPVAETFFSPAFGMGTDRFGIPWMIDAAPAPG